MARRSQRFSGDAKAITTHKRTASNTTPSSAVAKKQRATPTKSQYFEKEDNHSDAAAAGDDDGDDDDEDVAMDSSPDDDEVSEFGDEDEDSVPSEATDHDDYDDDDDRPSSTRKRVPAKGSARPSATIVTKGNELLREGVKTGLGPGTQVVIKKPKARPAGKTPYRDETIHPNTLMFLKELKANNERQWLKSKCHSP